MRIIITALSILFSLVSNAYTDNLYKRVYRNSDYYKFTQSIKFDINQSAAQKLNNPCKEAALAALAGTQILMAMEDGVDIPETVDVDRSNYLSNLKIFVIQSGNEVYSILTQVKNNSCQASLIVIDSLE